MGTGSLIWRKVVTTFVAAVIFSAILGYGSEGAIQQVEYNQGNQFIGWTFIYFLYIGVIMLIYGNLVSIGIEYLQSKWFRKQDWLYVIILGVFGLANGLLFQEVSFAILGMIAAILYAVIDKWIYRRMLKDKGIVWFIIVPVVAIFITWGTLQLLSPPMPPFTADDAVAFATSGEDMETEYFPREIGVWKGNVEGFEVKRETSAEEIDKEIYLVTFTESWEKGDVKGSWSFSYKVERNSLSAHGGNGEIPPYYK
ncbi:hypothetical protein [Bacillus suaedaesalsae]|uniref:hypothetical protein n=1 Tax=Bacillus suaedaesalsae TaxID=2810349 RepID=UPI003211AC5E